MRKTPRNSLYPDPFATHPSDEDGKSSNSKGNTSTLLVPIIIILVIVFKNHPKIILIIMAICLLILPFLIIIGLNQKSERKKQLEIEADLKRENAEKIAQSDRIRAEIGRRLVKERKIIEDELVRKIKIEKIGQLIEAIYISKKAQEYSNQQELTEEEKIKDSQYGYGQEEYSYNYYS